MERYTAECPECDGFEVEVRANSEMDVNFALRKPIEECPNCDTETIQQNVGG